MKTMVSAIALLTAVASVSPSNAADIYAAGGYKDAPVVALAPLWTGFYLGLGVQGDFSSHKLSLDANTTNIATLDGLSGQGAGFVATVGADYQIPGSRFVVGVGFDYDVASASTSFALPTLTKTFSYDLTDYWTAFGRVGFLSASQNVLFYGKGGFGQASFHPSLLGASITDHTFDGFVVGGGIEVRLDSFIRGASVRLEYTDFIANSANETWTFGKNKLSVTDDLNIQSVKLIAAYKLGAGGDFIPLK